MGSILCNKMQIIQIKFSNILTIKNIVALYVLPILLNIYNIIHIQNFQIIISIVLSKNVYLLYAIKLPFTQKMIILDITKFFIGPYEDLQLF